MTMDVLEVVEWHSVMSLMTMTMMMTTTTSTVLDRWYL